MQAEGIKAGDRYDVLDDRGQVIGGWTATGDAVIGEHNRVRVPVRFHDGEEGTNSWAAGMQVPLTFGAGGDMQRTVKYPKGTPEYDRYQAELHAELEKFRDHEAPYDGDELA
jgi:hypothetical protein